MVTEGLLNIFFTFVEGLLSLLPNISWTVNASFVTSAIEFLACVGYVLPMGTVITILTLVCSIQAFRIVVSLVKTIWALLPIV